MECIVGVANFQDVTASGRALQCGTEGLRGGGEGEDRGEQAATRSRVTSRESSVRPRRWPALAAYIISYRMTYIYVSVASLRSLRVDDGLLLNYR